MRKLIRDCTPWLNWKAAAMFAALLLGLLVIGFEARIAALLGATPLLALLICLIPCAIPLLLLRRGAPKTTATSRSGCGCGSTSCAESAAPGVSQD